MGEAIGRVVVHIRTDCTGKLTPASKQAIVCSMMCTNLSVREDRKIHGRANKILKSTNTSERGIEKQEENNNNNKIRKQQQHTLSQASCFSSAAAVAIRVCMYVCVC